MSPFLTWTGEGKHDTGIQWTQVPGYRGATWNPTTGCTRVSPGCDHCYAFTLHDQRHVTNRNAARFSTSVAMTPAEYRAAGLPLPHPAQYDLPFSTVQVLGEDRLTEPLRKQKPHAYFVDSMADLFHEDVPDEAIDRVFAVMALAPQHLFMVLTKRPERMRDYVNADSIDVGTPKRANRGSMVLWAAQQMADNGLLPRGKPYPWSDEFNGPGQPLEWPLPNVWLGVSAEDQERADERIPLLLDTPAAVRFVSAEPLIDAIDFTDLDYRVTLARHYPGAFEFPPHPNDPAIRYDVLTGHMKGPDDIGLPRLDWVIVGGESGPHARVFDIEWARAIVEQCKAAGVAVFVKQLGSNPSWGAFEPIRLKHNHGGNPDEWPEDLRVREFPLEASA